MTITVKELASLINASATTAFNRLHKLGRRVSKCNKRTGEYLWEVDDDKKEELLAPSRYTQCVDMLTVAEISGITARHGNTVRRHLRIHGVTPAFAVSSKGRYARYLITEVPFDEIKTGDVRGIHPKCPIQANDEGPRLLADEKEKQAWVGRMGYFQWECSRSDVGKIKVVSMIGCVVGSDRGDLRDLRLCDEDNV